MEGLLSTGLPRLVYEPTSFKKKTVSSVGFVMLSFSLMSGSLDTEPLKSASTACTLWEHFG